LLRHSTKDDVRDVAVKVLKSEDDVSDLGNVGFSEDTTKPPADCRNEMGEAIVTGAQKIHKYRQF